eukprot:gene2854-3652_t
MSLQSALARCAAQLNDLGSTTHHLDDVDYRSLNTQLIRVLQAMERVHDLILAWGGTNDTFFGKLKRALISRHFHEEFVQCNQQLSDCMGDLRGDATLQMFIEHVTIPESLNWAREDQQDSYADLQMMPSAIVSAAETQNELNSHLADQGLNFQELKVGLEAHGVTIASLEYGFEQLDFKVDDLESKLDLYTYHHESRNAKDLSTEISKLEELLQQDNSVSGGKVHEMLPSKTNFLSENMPRLTIPYSELRIVEEVGSGGFGTVYRGTWQGNEVAYKQVMIRHGSTKGTKRQVLALYKEAYAMSLLRSPLVCGLYGVTLEAQHYGLVLPFYRGGTLDDFLRDEQVQVTEQMYVHLALSIATAMVCLHNRSVPVVHGDLKSRNVQLAVPWKPGVLPQLVLCDFGLSSVKMDVQSTVGTSTVTEKQGGGTLNWKAPELLEQNAKVTKESDVYAFAMVM